jgi:hypothetical protein
MFNFFKKDPIKELEEKYRKMLEESFKLSTVNRAESDKLRAKAEEVAMEIDKLKNNN